MTKNASNRWIILITGMVMLLFLGLIYGWSIFRAPLSGFFPEWNTSQLSMAFTISMIFFCLGGFFSGQMLKKINHRVMLVIAAVIGFVGFFGISLLDTDDPTSSLKRLYICYGVCCGFAVGISYNCVISTVNKWFADRLGFASGTMLMGFGLGGIVLGGIVNVFIGKIGLFATFKVLAIGIFVILMAGALLLKAPEIIKKETAAAERLSENDLTPSQMLRKPSFWLFFVWCLLLNSAGLIIINNAAPIAVAFGAPAVLGLLVSVFNGVSRIFIGSIFDRFGRNTAMLVNMGFTATAGILLLFGDMTGLTVIIIIGMLFTGLGYGATPATGAVYVSREFGTKYYPVNFSICNFCLIPASIIGPMISSKLIDMSAGGYTGNFIMMIILAALAVATWVFVNKFTVHKK